VTTASDKWPRVQMPICDAFGQVSVGATRWTFFEIETVGQDLVLQ